PIVHALHGVVVAPPMRADVEPASRLAATVERDQERPRLRSAGRVEERLLALRSVRSRVERELAPWPFGGYGRELVVPARLAAASEKRSCEAQKHASSPRQKFASTHRAELRRLRRRCKARAKDRAKGSDRSCRRDAEARSRGGPSARRPWRRRARPRRSTRR